MALDNSDSGCLTWIIIFVAFILAFNRINDLEEDVKELKQHYQIEIDSVQVDTLLKTLTYEYII